MIDKILDILVPVKLRGKRMGVLMERGVKIMFLVVVAVIAIERILRKTIDAIGDTNQWSYAIGYMMLYLFITALIYGLVMGGINMLISTISDMKCEKAGEENPVVRGTLDAKNIFSPKTIKQFWPDLAEHLKDYGVSKAEGRVPKSAYTDVATMEAVVRQKQSQIDELSELVLQGQERFQEVEQRLSDASEGLDNLEDLIRAIEGPNIATSVNMDYDIQETVAMTLFPSLADWEYERLVGENSLVMYNSRTMDSICLNFSSRGVYVREHKRTDEVDHNGRYVFRWMPEQRYTDYLQRHPRDFRILDVRESLKSISAI